MKGLFRNGEVVEGIRQFYEGTQEGFVPDGSLYELLFATFCEVGLSQYAETLLHDMTEADIRLKRRHLNMLCAATAQEFGLEAADETISIFATAFPGLLQSEFHFMWHHSTDASS